MTLHQRILSLLALAPCNTLQVSRRLAVTTRRAGETLRRLEATGQVRRRGDLWERRVGAYRRSSTVIECDAAVLTAVEELDTPVAAELVRRTGWPRSSVYRSLSTLRSLGLVVQLRPVARSVRWRAR